MKKLSETLHALHAAIQTAIEKNTNDLLNLKPIDIEFLKNPNHSLKQKLLFVSAHIPEDGEIAQSIRSKVLDIEGQLSKQALQLGDEISKILVEAIEMLNKSIQDNLKEQKTGLIDNIKTFFGNLPNRAMSWGQSLKQKFSNIKKSLSFSENPTAYIDQRIKELKEESPSLGRMFKLFMLNILHFFSGLLFPNQPEEIPKSASSAPVSSSFFERSHVASESDVKFTTAPKATKDASLPRQNICTTIKEASESCANTACSIAQSGFGLFQSGIKSAVDGVKSFFKSDEPNPSQMKAHNM